MRTPTPYEKRHAALDLADWERIKTHLVRERQIALDVARANDVRFFMTDRFIAKARAILVRRTIQLATVRAHHRRIDNLRGAAQ